MSKREYLHDCNLQWNVTFPRISVKQLKKFPIEIRMVKFCQKVERKIEKFLSFSKTKNCMLKWCSRTNKNYK